MNILIDYILLLCLAFTLASTLFLGLKGIKLI